jgi:hypothetical protein
MKSMHAALLALFALALTACGPKPEQEQAVRTFFEDLRAGDMEAVSAQAAQNLRTPDSMAQLETIRREYIPPEAPQNVFRSNWSYNSVVGGDTTATFTHRYDYPDRILLVGTVTRTAPDGPTLVEGFHVNVTEITPDVVAAANFSFENTTRVHWAFFACLVFSVLLMVWAFLGVIFTKGFKRKWLFAILAFVGAPVFLMNWSTGEWVVQATLGLINTGVMRGLGPLDPWFVRFQAPIGALITLSVLWPRWLGLGAAAGPAQDNR